MIKRQDDRLFLSGSLTADNVGMVLTAGLKEIAGGARQVDLTQVSNVDSSAICLLFEWMRKSNNTLKFYHLPDGLINLAGLYGVIDMIPQG